MALTNKLSAIGAAIREKTGGTELLTLDQMPQEIASITTGGGEIPEEMFNITGNCRYRFANNGWNGFIDTFGNRIKTKDINNCYAMFTDSTNLSTIPFSINPITTGAVDVTMMFGNCNNLTELPQIGYYQPNTLTSMFQNCHRIREIPKCYEDNIDLSYIEKQTSSSAGNASSMFSGCNSLRKVPMELIRSGNPNLSYSWGYLRGGFQSCYVLDELVDLPLYFKSTWTSNGFTNTFDNCSRLKRLTFETNADGTPKVMNWKNQTIDLSRSVGWNTSTSYFINYNSGITADKQVKNKETYEVLKDNPDWFSTTLAFSRYNHDSAVETINSLPDTSAYLASAGGTNTIKFQNASTSGEHNGIIYKTLTEEEIAIAAAKGWTVSFG